MFKRLQAALIFILFLCNSAGARAHSPSNIEPYPLSERQKLYNCSILLSKPVTLWLFSNTALWWLNRVSGLKFEEGEIWQQREEDRILYFLAELPKGFTKGDDRLRLAYRVNLNAEAVSPDSRQGQVHLGLAILAPGASIRFTEFSSLNRAPDQIQIEPYTAEELTAQIESHLKRMAEEAGPRTPKDALTRFIGKGSTWMDSRLKLHFPRTEPSS